MLKLIVICIGVIIIISTLIDKDPMNILTGLGASAAILMLVFKDTIMGLVAGYNFQPIICFVRVTGLLCLNMGLTVR